MDELKEKTEQAEAEAAEAGQKDGKQEKPAEESVDAEQEEKRNSTAVHAGVTGEQYDLEPETPEQTADVFKGEDAIRIEYSFTGEEIKNGLRVFQRETMFKKNMIYTLVLAAFFGIYSFSAFQKDPNALTIFICIMCISIMAFIWYMPWNHRRLTARAVDGAQDTLSFVMFIYPTGIRINEEKGSCAMQFGKEINKIAETEESFLFFAGKERLFVLPKRFVADEEAVRGCLKAGMGGKYLVRIKEEKK